MAGGLIVGLGNPGPKYAQTRHNLGFLMLDALLAAADDVQPQAGKFQAELWRIRLRGVSDPWLCAKPQTFMNLSGAAVQPLAAWHRIPPDRILVIHDELDLPPGRMKCKCGGGDAGHNGLKSITERLGTPDYYRLRLGIGRSPFPGGDTANWVLGRLGEIDEAAFAALRPVVCDAVRLFMDGDAAGAVRLINAAKRPTPAPDKAL